MSEQEREALDPNTPPERLEALAAQQELGPLLAKNPNTPVPILWRLGFRSPAQLLENPALPLLFLENPAIGEKVPEATACALLREPSVPEWLVVAFVSHADFHVRREVAQHTKATLPLLSRLSKDTHLGVLHALALNPRTPAEILASLVEKVDRRTKRYIAKHLNASLETLQLFATCGDLSLQEEVAKHPNAPLSALESLSQNAYVDLRRHAARNPRTPEPILARLIQDVDEFVRRNVAQNPNTTPELLARLAKDQNPHVRSCVAANPKTPRSALEALSFERSPGVRQSVAKNPSTPLLLLELLSNDRKKKVRWEVAQKGIKTILPQKTK